MREIIFRGKCIDNGEWVEGDLFQRLGYYPEIITHNPGKVGKVTYSSIRVDPSTVGQYTGLKDKNGNKIFEGDIIRSYDSLHNEVKHYVHYIDSEGSFCVTFINNDTIDYMVNYHVGNIYQHWIDEFEKELIGNIYDNPEIMNSTSTIILNKSIDHILITHTVHENTNHK